MAGIHNGRNSVNVQNLVEMARKQGLEIVQILHQNTEVKIVRVWEKIWKHNNVTLIIAQ